MQVHPAGHQRPSMSPPSIGRRQPRPRLMQRTAAQGCSLSLSSLLSLASPAITHALHSRLLGLASRCGRGALFTGSQAASRYSPKSPKAAQRMSVSRIIHVLSAANGPTSGEPRRKTVVSGKPKIPARGRNSMAPQFASLSTSRSFPNGSCNE